MIDPLDRPHRAAGTDRSALRAGQARCRSAHRGAARADDRRRVGIRRAAAGDPAAAARRSAARRSSGSAPRCCGSPRPLERRHHRPVRRDQRHGPLRMAGHARQRRIAGARRRDRRARARDRSARGRAVHHGRPHRPRRRPRAARQASGPVRASARSPACGCSACSSTTGERSRSPGGPAASPTRGACAARSAWRSRCSCSRSVAGRRWRPRWRRAGSAAAAPRSWARESVWDRRDTLLVVVAAVIPIVAIAVAVLTGAWNFILGPTA